MTTTTPPTHLPPPYAPTDSDSDPDSTFRHIITSMLNSHHHKFGFLIYRVNYDNDALWQNYLNIIDQQTREYVVLEKKEHLLPHIAWTPMEDREKFEGATKDEIREFFRDWIHERSEDRDGPGAGVDNTELIRWSPRYKACMYVNGEMMQGAKMQTVDFLPGGPQLHVQGKGVVVDGQYDEHDRDVLRRSAVGAREDFEEVEGRRGWDVGWMYFTLRGVHMVYETLCMSEEEWTSP
ncbi:hypothetical protein B0T14DRAFT_565461 [Immersiella caudata]|uniref:Uncharacterized protein n=1 Tax=Immersiella caudata TaxID=314043 RepID=A0AA39WYW1_9PEZI|nr:hypothetical protein B0T14DRAFT_565461 [Immersiella caudata]